MLQPMDEQGIPMYLETQRNDTKDYRETKESCLATQIETHAGKEGPPSRGTPRNEQGKSGGKKSVDGGGKKSAEDREGRSRSPVEVASTAA